MADPLQDTAGQAAQGGAEEDMGQGYCIEINVDAQGKITVGVEAKQEEAGEESGAQGADADPEEANDGAQPVGSIKEAISLVLDIYKNSGQMADMDTGNDQFNAGFGAKKPAADMGGM